MRTDRYRKGGKHAAIQGKRLNTLLLVFLLLIAVTAGAVYTLMSMISIDRRFTRNVARGVTSGWALEADETQLQTEGRITDTAFIDAEYDAVSEYMNRTYKDDELGILAKEYTSALNDCRKAAKKYDPAADFDSFWAEFSGPYGRRVRALYKLHSGDFGLDLSDDNYREESEYLLSQGWLLETVSGLKFRSYIKDGVRTFETRISNDSGRDIDYLNIDVELLDKDGKATETSSIYLNDIKAGEVMPLKFISTSENSVSYRVVSETFRFKDDEADGQ